MDAWTEIKWCRGGYLGKDSPWGLGGHIAYLDGHVQFYNEIGPEDGQLINPANGTLTSNMADVHPTDKILLAPSL